MRDISFLSVSSSNRCYEGNAKYEQATKSAANTEDSARVRETIGDHGYEGGDDQRTH